MKLNVAAIFDFFFKIYSSLTFIPGVLFFFQKYKKKYQAQIVQKQ